MIDWVDIVESSLSLSLSCIYVRGQQDLRLALQLTFILSALNDHDSDGILFEWQLFQICQ